ncbi:LysR family transcriptional regulator [Lactobacillus sp. ESL0785]|uniref:LysR family transcriptional regulator n=1 Tax=Lactobacillus sp. ESL0785 TaxID=2983232 RepID=UPI0023F6B9A0|nr:LysR family transcriptional regulator [Lactobacillus sp. ESL0785]WEV70549.1 LysR family transcriptional regulator [Lactobacillus sp. ESL0785]
MKLRVLRYFLAIINEQNISRAAAKLHVSQPTISRQIHELETELGTHLFERGNKTIKLTADGEYLANQASQILTLTNKTIANIGKNNEVTGSIFIGCSEAPMLGTIADVIKQLNRIAPKISITLHSCAANEVHHKMQNGVFDFGFVLEPFDKTKYNFLTLPGITRWGVLTDRHSSLATKSQIKVADLINKPVIMPGRPNSQTLLTNWLGQSNLKFQVVANYNLLNNAAILAKHGVGHVLCLDGIVNTAQTNLIFIPLDPKINIHANLIWSKERLLSHAAQLFLTQLKIILQHNNY